MFEQDEDIEKRFNHHSPNEPTAKLHEETRAKCKELAYFVKSLPAGREQSLELTNLEEVMFWANAAIARNPVGAMPLS